MCVIVVKIKKAFLLTEAGHFIGHSLRKADESSGMILNFETRKDVFPLVSGDRFGHAGNSFWWYMARWSRLKNRVFWFNKISECRFTDAGGSSFSFILFNIKPRIKPYF